MQREDIQPRDVVGHQQRRSGGLRAADDPDLNAKPGQHSAGPELNSLVSGNGDAQPVDEALGFLVAPAAAVPPAEGVGLKTSKASVAVAMAFVSFHLKKRGSPMIGSIFPVG